MVQPFDVTSHAYGRVALAFGTEAASRYRIRRAVLSEDTCDARTNSCQLSHAKTTPSHSYIAVASVWQADMSRVKENKYH